MRAADTGGHLRLIFEKYDSRSNAADLFSRKTYLLTYVCALLRHEPTLIVLLMTGKLHVRQILTIQYHQFSYPSITISFIIEIVSNE